MVPALLLQLRAGPCEATEETLTLQYSSLSKENESVLPGSAKASDPSSWPTFVASRFKFSYPPDLRIIEEDIFAASYAPEPVRSTVTPVKENPVKAEVESEDGLQRVSVVVRLASGIKPTFTQVTDISQWGTVKEVATLLLPPGATVVAYDTFTVKQPPKQGPFGPIERDPTTLYWYQVMLRDQTQVAMSVGALKGQIYVMGAAAPAEVWQRNGESLRKCAESFRLIM